MSVTVNLSFLESHQSKKEYRIQKRLRQGVAEDQIERLVKKVNNTTLLHFQLQEMEFNELRLEASLA